MIAAWLLNVAAYSLQLAVLVTSALVVATIVRVRAPGPALWFWRATLLGALLLPFTQRSGTPSPDALTSSASLVGRALSRSTLAGDLTTVASIGAMVLICGAAGRMVWLALGFVRVRAIRQRSCPLVPTPAFVDDLARRLNVSAEIRVSDDIDGPVAVGLRRPSALLPTRALALSQAVQRAIVCHELIHVQRRDWAHVVLEEVWCALLWFHPAAPLVVSRIALMREAVVDRHTLAITGDRRAYVDALMTFAEPATPAPPLVPSLIRPRYLSQRIALLAREASMSPRHIATAFTIGCMVVSAATVATASRFPITFARTNVHATSLTVDPGAQDQPARPGDGVSLPRVLTEVKPEYTPAALQAKIQGSVELDVVVEANGEPGTIQISKPLDTVHGLDEAAMRAAAQWRFEPGLRNGEPVPVLVTVEMTFRLR